MFAQNQVWGAKARDYTPTLSSSFPKQAKEEEGLLIPYRSDLQSTKSSFLLFLRPKYSVHSEKQKTFLLPLPIVTTGRFGRPRLEIHRLLVTTTDA